MSVLMRPRLFSMPFQQNNNVKLLRYIGGRTNNLEFRKVIHARSIVSDPCSRDNIPEINALIDLYTNREAHHVYNQKSGGHGFAFEVVRLFKSMVSDHDESCPPNEYISGLVLSSCANVGHLLLGRQCHGYLLKSGLVFTQYVKTALVRLYSMLSDVVGAMEVSDCNRGLDICSYNLILVGLVEKGYMHEALVVLRRMLAEDMEWNKATYTGVFDLCARKLDLDLGRQVHSKLIKKNIKFGESLFNAMIGMYAKCGEISSAEQIFFMFVPESTVVLTTILAAYLEHGSSEASLVLFLDARHHDAVPDESTFCVLFNASAKLFSTRCGNMLHSLAMKTGFKGHKNVEDALIDMYLRTCDIKAAENVFLGMKNYHRDIVTWNAMICGYCHHGLGNDSLALFQEMLESGDQDPDYVTFVGVLSACGQVGLVEQGFYYLYELMKKKGVEPGLDHYTCIINMLIKAGKLNEALSFIVSTPSKWDVYAWTSLLSGCRAHGNKTLGIRATELIPADVATKVSKWFGVTQVREVLEIREDYIKEELTPSWVEVGDVTYVFASVEQGHPKYEMFDDIMTHFRSCVKRIIERRMPHIDVDVAMKRNWGGYYLGEEVCIAFAAYNAAVSAPVIIIKCSGKMSVRCHTLMKLASIATARLIMVRDAQFFHHFKKGRCSCADYW